MSAIVTAHVDELGSVEIADASDVGAIPAAIARTRTAVGKENFAFMAWALLCSDNPR
jgi:hypothetical protein